MSLTKARRNAFRYMDARDCISSDRSIACGQMFANLHLLLASRRFFHVDTIHVDVSGRRGGHNVHSLLDIQKVIRMQPRISFCN